MHLTPGHIYYCQYEEYGISKPLFRGKLHFISLFTLFPYYYFNMKPHFIYSFIGNFLCFLVSAIYHTVDFDLQSEQIIRMIDLLMIYVYIIMTYISFSKPSLYSIIPFSLFIYFVYDTIANVRHNPLNYVYLSLSIQPNIDRRTILNFIILGIGFYIMQMKLIQNDIFGYHEILHLSTIISSYILFSIEVRYDSRENTIL